MAKHVVIIASGEIERRALPHLAGHLRDRAITVVEVRIPPRNGALNPQMAERLKHLLGEHVYSARVSEEIAETLDSGTIAERSPSFKKFVDPVMNGGSETQPPTSTVPPGRDCG